MAMSGGRFPFDQLEALSGPARILIAPITAPIPADPYTIAPAVADAQGEYPAVAPWRDTGLMADSPTYSHGRETEGLEYEQVAGALFEKISSITRTFTAQVAGISAVNMQLIESSPVSTTVAAAANKSAGDKLAFGVYSSLTRYRIALLADRPDGAGLVTEPAPSNRSRPPSVALVMYECSLAAEESEVEWSRGEPVNVEIAFSLFPATGQPAGKEHGYWFFEKTGTILAT